jgi:hypothetical protein
MGLVSVGHMWLRMARAALARRADGDERAAFYDAKLATARFYMTKILPQSRTLAATIEAGAEPVMALAAEASEGGASEELVPDAERFRRERVTGDGHSGNRSASGAALSTR